MGPPSCECVFAALCPSERQHTGLCPRHQRRQARATNAPACRDAVSALATEISATNTALARLLHAHVASKEQGSSSARRLSQDDAFIFWLSAWAVQGYAGQLLLLPGITDAPRLAPVAACVAGAGLAILESGTLALRLAGEAATDMEMDSLHLHQLLLDLTAPLVYLDSRGAAQGDALRTLRATSLCPDAILGGLRRLLWRELAGGDAPRAGEAAQLSVPARCVRCARCR